MTTLDRVHLLRQMLLVRRFEERCVELYSAATIRGFVHLCIGEEATVVGATQALADGMLTMYDDGLRKALAGQTTIEEVLRVTRED